MQLAPSHTHKHQMCTRQKSNWSISILLHSIFFFFPSFHFSNSLTFHKTAKKKLLFSAGCERVCVIVFSVKMWEKRNSSTGIRRRSDEVSVSLVALFFFLSWCVDCTGKESHLASLVCVSLLTSRTRECDVNDRWRQKESYRNRLSCLQCCRAAVVVVDFPCMFALFYTDINR